jgi:hypothetical protein
LPITGTTGFAPAYQAEYQGDIKRIFGGFRGGCFREGIRAVVQIPAVGPVTNKQYVSCFEMDATWETVSVWADFEPSPGHPKATEEVLFFTKSSVTSFPK